MKVTLVLCVLVGLAVALPETDITTSDIQPNIVGGTTATPGQFPYQASLRTTPYTHFCGGSIYTTRWVISAAHCFKSKTPANTIVVVGAHSRLTGGIIHNVEAIINHPQYNANNDRDDISLVKTQLPINFVTGLVAAIPLNTATIDGVVDCVASGWGQTLPGSIFLQFLKLKTMSLAACRAGHTPTNRAKIFDNNICTTSPAGKGLCMGDSGGPLAANGSLIGIVSWGIPCGLTYPDVFTRVSSHVSWITNTAN